jgi:hypothetical protein
MMEVQDVARSPTQSRDDYMKLLLLERIRSLIKKRKSPQRLGKDAALLQDVLVRLRLWEKDLAICSEHFDQYEGSNESMVQLLLHQVGKIHDKVGEIEKMEESREDDMFGYDASNPLNSAIVQDKNVVHCSYYTPCSTAHTNQLSVEFASYKAN